jgi:hypothetical protein
MELTATRTQLDAHGNDESSICIHVDYNNKTKEVETVYSVKVWNDKTKTCIDITHILNDWFDIDHFIDGINWQEEWANSEDVQLENSPNDEQLMAMERMVELHNLHVQSTMAGALNAFANPLNGVK